METKLLFIFVLIALSLGCAASESATPSRWHFIDTRSGAAVVLSADESRLAIGEFAERATFCEKGSELICFSSNGIVFSVPKKIQINSEWNFSGYSSEVVNRYDSQVDTFYVVWSRKKESVNGESTMIAIYSPSRGLRFIASHTAGGSLIELFATDEVGFGGSDIRQE